MKEMEGIAAVKSEWKTVAFGDVATIERSTIQPDEISQGTACLGLEHIENSGKPAFV